jgi:hypothetical protein
MITKRIFFSVIFLLIARILMAQMYKVGDLYTAPDGSKGIVFFVYPDNSGGLVVALNDASAGCPWGNQTDVPELPNQDVYYAQQLLSDTAGYAKTQAIRSVNPLNTQCAACLVDIEHGWFLPSPAQLRILYAQLPFISASLIEAGGTDLANDRYWSSGEYSATNAWRLDMGNLSDYAGSLSNSSKSFYSRVREIRRFNNQSEDVSYLWNNGSTTPSVTVAPSETNAYSVTVTFFDGCVGSAEKHIEVTPFVEQDEQVVICLSDLPFAYRDTVFGLETPSVSTYSIRQTVPDGCDTITHLFLSVKSNNQVSIQPLTSDTVCSGDPATLLVSEETDGISRVTIGDIVCTDGTIVKPAFWPISGKTAMGVVFYVDSTGQHGWMAHPQVQNNYSNWGGQGIDIESLTNYQTSREAIMDLNGYSNTQSIRNAGDAETFPAVWTVDFANGWYVPSAGQLRLLTSQVVVINNTLQIIGGDMFSESRGWTYLSSTESSATLSWHVESNGYVGSYNKDASNGHSQVRSVHDF